MISDFDVKFDQYVFLSCLAQAKLFKKKSVLNECYRKQDSVASKQMPAKKKGKKIWNHLVHMLLNNQRQNNLRLCADLCQNQKFITKERKSGAVKRREAVSVRWKWWGNKDRQTYTQVSINKTWLSDFPTSKHKKAAAEPQLGFKEGWRQHSSWTSATLKCTSLAFGRVTLSDISLVGPWVRVSTGWKWRETLVYEFK